MTLDAFRKVPVTIDLANDPVHPIRVNQGDFNGRFLYVRITDDHVPVTDSRITARLTFNTNGGASSATASGVSRVATYATRAAALDPTAAGDWVPMDRVYGQDTATFQCAIPQSALTRSGEIVMGVDILDSDGSVIASRPFKALVDPSTINFNLKLADGRGYLEAVYSSVQEMAESAQGWAQVAQDAAKNFGISIGTVTTVDYEQGANATIDSNGGTKVLNLQIPRGLPGPQGVPGSQGVAGPAGPRGETGSGLRIKGSSEDETGRPTSGLDEGDGWLIGSDLYVWVSGQWKNMGQFKGPSGTSVYLASVNIEPNSAVSKSSLPVGVENLVKVGDGVLGKDGRTYTVATVSEDTFTVGNLIGTINVGVAGPAGPQGSPGIQGIQGPRGEVGPMPFDTVSSEVVSEDEVSAELVKNGDKTDLHLKLPTRGSVGPAGPAGPKGDPGESIVGPQGPVGPAGPQGSPGRDGQDGKDGVSESQVNSLINNATRNFITESEANSNYVSKSDYQSQPNDSGSLSGSSLSNGRSLGSLTAPASGTYLIYWQARIGAMNGNGNTSASIICSAGNAAAQCAVAVGGNGTYDGSAQTCTGLTFAPLSNGQTVRFTWETTSSGGSITYGRCGLVRLGA